MYIVRSGNFYVVHNDSGEALIGYLLVFVLIWAFNLTFILAIMAIKLSFLICAALLKGVWKLLELTVHAIAKPVEEDHSRLQHPFEQYDQVGQGQMSLIGGPSDASGGSGVLSIKLDELHRFQSTHRAKRVMLGQHTWEYIACGSGQRGLLIIPGNPSSGDAYYRLIPLLDGTYRMIVPTLPPLSTIDEAVSGIEEILRIEGHTTFDMLGGENGGNVALCLLRLHPSIIGNVVLFDAVPPGSLDLTEAPDEIKKLEETPTRIVRGYLNDLVDDVVVEQYQDYTFWKAYFEDKYKHDTVKDDAIALLRQGLDYHTNWQLPDAAFSKWNGNGLNIFSGKARDEERRKATVAWYERMLPRCQSQIIPDLQGSLMYCRPAEFEALVCRFFNVPFD